MKSAQSPSRRCKGPLRRNLTLSSRKSQIFCWHGESKHAGEYCRVAWFLLNSICCRISPVPDEERVDKRLYQMFFVWFSANFNVLAFSTGCAGPAFFNLGLRDSLVTILVVDAMSYFQPRIMTP